MFGDNLKYLRKKYNMSSKQVAELLNVSTATMSRYEMNTREPDFKKLKEISNIFNVSIDFLLDNDVNNKLEDTTYIEWFKSLNDTDKQKLKDIWQIIDK